MVEYIRIRGTSQPTKVDGHVVFMAKRIVMPIMAVRTGKNVVDNVGHNPLHHPLPPIGGIQETIGRDNLALTISGTAMVPADRGKISTFHLTVWYTITNGFVFLSCGTCINMYKIAVCEFCTGKTWYE